MSRKRIVHPMPSLATALPTFRGFDPQQNVAAALRDQLRRLAEAARGSQPVAFYPMREVAAFFRVPLGTVAAVYHDLGREGYLTPLRGSKTLLQPRAPQPRVPVRGVVGLPVWLYGFWMLPDWREFHIQIEEQLRRQGFVADLVFYHAAEHARPELADRLLSHELDHLIWLLPLPECQPIMATLADHGVRVIALTTPVCSFSCQRYFLSWDQAITDGLAAWRRERISTVVVPRPNDPNRRACDRQADVRFEKLLAQSHLSWRWSRPAVADWSDYVRSLARGPTEGVLFDDDLWCSHLCSRATEAMLELLQRRRVLVTRPLNLPRALLAGIRLDAAVMHWDHVARRLATDLAAAGFDATAPPVTFQAVWQPDTPAAEFAQKF